MFTLMYCSMNLVESICVKEATIKFPFILLCIRYVILAVSKQIIPQLVHSALL